MGIIPPSPRDRMVWSSEGAKLGAGDGPEFDSPAPHRLARARRGRRRWGPPGGGTRSAVDDPPRVSGDPDEPSPRPSRGGHRVGSANMTSDTLDWYKYGRSSMPLSRISGRGRVGCSPVVRCAGLGPAALARWRDEILPCRESLVSPVYCGGPSRVRSHGQSRAGRVRCPRHTSGFRWISPIEADRIGRPHDHRPRLYRGRDGVRENPVVEFPTDRLLGDQLSESAIDPPAVPAKRRRVGSEGSAW
jgi:hypothetical protein